MAEAMAPNVVFFNARGGGWLSGVTDVCHLRVEPRVMSGGHGPVAWSVS